VDNAVSVAGCAERSDGLRGTSGGWPAGTANEFGRLRVVVFVHHNGVSSGSESDPDQFVQAGTDRWRRVTR